MPVAPRVLNKIHDKVQAGMHAAGGLKLALFKRGLAVKREGLKKKKILLFFGCRLRYANIFISSYFFW